MKTLLLGLGNIILRDEGLGVRAVERIRERYVVGDDVELMDGGTLGLELLPYLEETDSVLIVDAIRTGDVPGTLIRLEGQSIPSALAIKMSMHQVGLQELLAISAIRETTPQRIVLWGIEPQLMEPGLDLTPLIESRMDVLIDSIVQELRSWGHELVLHSAHEDVA